MNKKENQISQIKQEEKHPKQDFQVDRIAFFSDAVFAIVITLLVIEFKVPHITSESTYNEILNELGDLKFNFLAILISFFVVAKQWMEHHFLFKYIHNYNSKIIWADLIILLTIVFFPFSTSFFAESTNNENIIVIGMRIFVLNNLCTTVASTYFYWITFIKNKTFTFKIPDIEKEKYFSNAIFSLVYSVIFLIMTYFFTDYKTIIYILAVITLFKKPIEILVKKLKLVNKF